MKKIIPSLRSKSIRYKILNLSKIKQSKMEDEWRSFGKIKAGPMGLYNFSATSVCNTSTRISIKKSGRENTVYVKIIS